MKIKIEFEVELPNVRHSQKQLEEYIRFHFRDNGSLSGSNPFEKENKREPEPIFGTFEWEYEEVNEDLVTDFDM
ncbi:Uncharacterised protein [Weeksella virosa]|uniref:Uncharacterized protein n=1 Tax=Weeksella virosa (strain ATCC 43766 / DSM 16922 / JCM 21250 / CCUG 30538 / CDC 9751 / IAM 14551 / NBRC 16016 / NCTC 11634 / CL345/78) TaxID=865938 RepID=F0NXT1_WEEVC|nr:hypothetical protein [Weeksella virosa]ADX66988.1 hypothetical protein Weevi_0266 [Weeksella virosa DSM 16922]VEH63283.1 Uncharacterised protein [Weeksella virosa]